MTDATGSRDGSAREPLGGARNGRPTDASDPREPPGRPSVATGPQARELLARARRIAIVGASPDPARPSHGVMVYLLGQGYECVPINPNAREVLGMPCFPDLPSAVAAGGPFDIVDVFRRSEAAPDIARETVAAGCRALWLQLGVISWEAVRIAGEAGLPVVMDRCTAIERRRWVRDRSTRA